MAEVKSKSAAASVSATAAERQAAKQAEVEAAVLEKIAGMPAQFREVGTRLRALVRRSAPMLEPRLFYGMPAYAKDGVTICFFRADPKYMTFGLTQQASLEREAGSAHTLIPASWYFTEIDEATEAKLAEIIRCAAR